MVVIACIRRGCQYLYETWLSMLVRDMVVSAFLIHCQFFFYSSLVAQFQHLHLLALQLFSPLYECTTAGSGVGRGASVSNNLGISRKLKFYI